MHALLNSMSKKESKDCFRENSKDHLKGSQFYRGYVGAGQEYVLTLAGIKDIHPGHHLAPGQMCTLSSKAKKLNQQGVDKNVLNFNFLIFH